MRYYFISNYLDGAAAGNLKESFWSLNIFPSSAQLFARRYIIRPLSHVRLRIYILPMFFLFAAHVFMSPYDPISFCICFLTVEDTLRRRSPSEAAFAGDLGSLADPENAIGAPASEAPLQVQNKYN
jgi:hypothetical protein